MGPKNRLQNLLRSEMVSFIGPIFQGLRGEIGDLKTQIRFQTKKIDDNTLELRFQGNRIDENTQELRSHSNRFDEITQEIHSQTMKIESQTLKIHGQTILMEQMDKKIDTALEASASVLDYEHEVDQLNRRVGHLEVDVNVIKLVLKSGKP
jgi:hypothetical protein